MTFEPGMPYFRQLSPTTWQETLWARQRCVFCPELLALGDKTCCPEHRAISDATVMPWEVEEAAS